MTLKDNLVTFATLLMAKITLASLSGSLDDLRSLTQCEKVTFHVEWSSADSLLTLEEPCPSPLHSVRMLTHLPNGAIYRTAALRWDPQHTVTVQSRVGKQRGSP